MMLLSKAHSSLMIISPVRYACRHLIQVKSLSAARQLWLVRVIYVLVSIALNASH